MIGIFLILLLDLDLDLDVAVRGEGALARVKVVHLDPRHDKVAMLAPHLKSHLVTPHV